MTRGRSDNVALVVTDEPTLDAARDVLEATLAIDRADVPATRHKEDIRQNYAAEGLRFVGRPPTEPSRGLTIEL